MVSLLNWKMLVSSIKTDDNFKVCWNKRKCQKIKNQYCDVHCDCLTSLFSHNIFLLKN